jgi:phosphatidylglycerophosphate synthase
MVSNKWLTIPNMLSLSRLVFLPLLFWQVWAGHHNAFLATYALVAVTDGFDGFLARKLNQVSQKGKEIDSFADLFFYTATAYFMYALFPDVILANATYLTVFFAMLAFSIVLSAVLFRRPVIMHTAALRLCAVLVAMVMGLSFFMDTTYVVRGILFLYYYGITESILIFLIYGNVDPDTKTIFHLARARSDSAVG